MTRLKVIIVDDHVLFQQGLKSILEKESSFDFEVLDCPNSGRALLNSLKNHHPDLIFLDLNMPDMDGIETLEAVKSQYPNIKIIVLTMYDDSKVVKKVLKAKVDGYVLKKYGKSQILQAVSRVMDDKTYISKDIAYHSKDIQPVSYTHLTLPTKA